MKIQVGSENPVKIEAVRDAFSRYFPTLDVRGLAVPSKVPDQPLNDETFIGAKNRALALKELSSDKALHADFCVSIEGGVREMYSRWFAFASVCIIDRHGRMGFGTTAHYELPPKVRDQVLNRKELGVVMDQFTGEHNTKHKNGAIGFLTKGEIDRTKLYVDGIIMALCPFIHGNLYFPG